MDRKGKILIPGIDEAVAPVTEEELALYDKIDFNLEEYSRDVGAEKLLHSCKVGCVHCEASHRALCGGPVGRSRACWRRSGHVRVSRSLPMVPTLESAVLGLELQLGGF